MQYLPTLVAALFAAGIARFNTQPPPRCDGEAPTLPPPPPAPEHDTVAPETPPSADELLLLAAYGGRLPFPPPLVLAASCSQGGAWGLDGDGSMGSPPPPVSPRSVALVPLETVLQLHVPDLGCSHVGGWHPRRGGNDVHNVMVRAGQAGEYA